MTKQFIGKSKEEKQEELRNIISDLETGIRNVFESENYLRYLQTFSKFHHYSLANTILIIFQCPQASHVASFVDWKKNFTRVVKRGEKGLKILVPTPKKVTKEKEIINPDGTTSLELITHEYLHFKIGHVYDISQTVGDPLPTIVKPLTYSSQQLSSLVEKLIATSPIPIAYDPSLGKNSANGYYNVVTEEIFLKPSLADLHKLKTIIHEFSHYKQETEYMKVVKSFDRDTKEVIAESTAFCVLEMLNNEFGTNKLSSDDYSFGYLASWSSGKDMKELRSSIDLISKISESAFEWIAPLFSEN